MLAKDIMTRDVVTVGPHTPVHALAGIFSRNGISGAPVVDGRGRIVGVVSEADVVAGKRGEVESIMSKRIISVTEDAAVEEIAALMTTHRVKRIPITRGERLAGIVSRADIVRALAMGKHIALYTPVYDL